LALFQFLGNSVLGYIRTPSLLLWMYHAYNPNAGTTEDDAHGLIVPFVVLGIFWWKRKQLVALPLRTWPPALLLIALGLLLHLAGFAIQQSRVSIVGLFTGIYGLMGLAWGPAFLRASFFPFFLFIFSIPFGSLAQPVTFPLRLIVCRLVEFVCHYLLAIDIIRDGTALRDPTGHYQYEVAAACSGIRSLVAILIMATVYSFVAFRSFGKRLVLMVSAFPLAVLGNLVRMLFIVIAAEIGGQPWGNYVHENTYFSLIPYIPAICGLLFLGHLLEGPKSPGEQVQPLPVE
jgi:exosortase